MIALASHESVSCLVYDACCWHWLLPPVIPSGAADTFVSLSLLPFVSSHSMLHCCYEGQTPR